VLYRQFATQDDIDAQYDLSKVIGDPSDYFQFYASESASARSDLDCLLDVRFGPTLEENLDIFPAQQRDAPILFFIHGGYWKRMSSKEFSYVARGLVARGITVIVPNYALCPVVTIPEITRQMRAAVAWARTTDFDYSGDRDRIFMCGHSAGGHLATRALCTDWNDIYGLPSDTVKGAYPISGLYDLTPLRYAFVQPVLQLTEDVIQKESPLFNIPPSAGPLIAEVGAQESDEFRRQSSEFVRAWKAAGLRGEYVEQAATDHFSVIKTFVDPKSDLCDRLASFVN
jgi:arylformamidase